MRFRRPWIPLIPLPCPVTEWPDLAEKFAAAQGFTRLFGAVRDLWKTSHLNKLFKHPGYALADGLSNQWGKTGAAAGNRIQFVVAQRTHIRGAVRFSFLV